MLFNVRKLRGCHWVISLVCRTRSRKFHLSNCLHELFFLSVLLWRVDTLLEVLCREDFHIKSTNVVLLLGVKKQFWYLLGYQASKALQRELLRHLLEYWSENNYDRRYSTINFTSRRYSKSVSYCIVSELIPPRGEKKNQTIHTLKTGSWYLFSKFLSSTPSLLCESPAGLDRQAYPFTLTKG